MRVSRRAFTFGGAVFLAAPYVAKAGLGIRGSGLSSPTFYDNFQRPDTSDGNIGNPSGGNSYSLLGPYAGSFPLPASSFGRIQSNRFVADANQIVYAEQQFTAPTHQNGGSIIWEAGGGSVTGATAAFLISTNANTVQNMFHCAVSRSTMLLQKRIGGGAFVTLGSKAISPVLSLNVEYQVIATLQGDNATFQIGNNVVASGTDTDLIGLPGEWLAWEIYQPDPSMIDLVRFTSAWAK